MTGDLMDVPGEHSAEDLRHLVEHDTLTGIPNRRYFMRDLASRAVHPSQPGQFLIVGIIDLNGFKNINDLYGHEVGDRLLVQVAGRLSGLMDPGDLMSRLGGDEFAFLLTGKERISVVRDRIEKILSVLKLPIPVSSSGEVLSIGGSIGATLFPDDDSDPKGLLHHADLALYEAKKGRSTGWSLYFPEVFDLSLVHHAANKFATALEEGKARFFFQPQIRFSDGSLCGAEALIRWEKETGTWDEARTFIDSVERTVVVKDLGRYALRQAGTVLGRCRDLSMDCPLSVNIGDRYAKSGEVSRDLWRILEEYPEVSSRLTLQVRERTAHPDHAWIRPLFSEIRSLGVTIAIDDFGLGGLSLPNLLSLDPDRIILNPELVRGMMLDPVRLGFIANVLLAGATSGVEVLATGVENEGHLRILRELGCAMGQGRFLGPAMSEDDFFSLKERSGPAAFSRICERALSPNRILLLFAREEPAFWMNAHRWILFPEESPPSELDLLLSGNRCRCGLGRWISGPGRRRFGRLEEFSSLTSWHERFHDCADALVGFVGRSSRMMGDALQETRMDLWKELERIAEEIGHVVGKIEQKVG